VPRREPLAPPLAHLSDLLRLGFPNGPGELCDLFVVGEAVPEQMLGHHHRVLMVGDHVVKEGLVQLVAG
jgi:hypothetical protein